jgi:hypothetical protein
MHRSHPTGAPIQPTCQTETTPVPLSLFTTKVTLIYSIQRQSFLASARIPVRSVLKSCKKPQNLLKNGRHNRKNVSIDRIQRNFSEKWPICGRKVDFFVLAVVTVFFLPRMASVSNFRFPRKRCEDDAKAMRASSSHRSCECGPLVASSKLAAFWGDSRPRR